MPVAISPDGLGTIFSGSAVVDKDNTAGFGANAIVAFYTQASARQMQSIAYSTDNGRTFKKYAGNPVLTGDVADFRDPKVSWHEGTHKWILTLAVGQEIRFYSSPNLKDWTYESNFGEGQGNHGEVVQHNISWVRSTDISLLMNRLRLPSGWTLARIIMLPLHGAMLHKIV